MSRINVMSVRIFLESIQSSWGFMPYDVDSLYINGQKMALLNDFSSMTDRGVPVPVKVECQCCKKVINTSVSELLNMRRDKGSYCPHCHAVYSPTIKQENLAEYKTEALSEEEYERLFSERNFIYDGCAPINRSDVFTRCKGCDGYMYGNYDAILSRLDEAGCPLCAYKRKNELNGMNPVFMKFIYIINSLGVKDRLKFRFTKENMESFVALDKPAQFVCERDRSHVMYVEPNKMINLAERLVEDQNAYIGCTCKSSNNNLMNGAFTSVSTDSDDDDFITVLVEDEEERGLIEVEPKIDDSVYMPVSIAVNNGEKTIEEEFKNGSNEDTLEVFTEEEERESDIEEVDGSTTGELEETSIDGGVVSDGEEDTEEISLAETEADTVYDHSDIDDADLTNDSNNISDKVTVLDSEVIDETPVVEMTEQASKDLSETIDEDIAEEDYYPDILEDMMRLSKISSLSLLMNHLLIEWRLKMVVEIV